MTELRLRVVTEAGRCTFCLRTMPREDLKLTPEGALICEEREPCCAEYERQEKRGWTDHPAFGQTA